MVTTRDLGATLSKRDTISEGGCNQHTIRGSEELASTKVNIKAKSNGDHDNDCSAAPSTDDSPDPRSLGLPSTPPIEQPLTPRLTSLINGLFDHAPGLPTSRTSSMEVLIGGVEDKTDPSL